MKSTGNDLEKAAIKMYPVIKNLIDSFHTTSGCLISRMSGSGSTCFGLYEKKVEAENAKKHLKKSADPSEAVGVLEQHRFCLS